MVGVSRPVMVPCRMPSLGLWSRQRLDYYIPLTTPLYMWIYIYSIITGFSASKFLLFVRYIYCLPDVIFSILIFVVSFSVARKFISLWLLEPDFSPSLTNGIISDILAPFFINFIKIFNSLCILVPPYFRSSLDIPSFPSAFRFFVI